MIPSFANKTTISSRNKTIQNGTTTTTKHTHNATTTTTTTSTPAPSQTHPKLNGIGSKTGALLKPPSQIPRTRVSQTPPLARTLSTASSSTLRSTATSVKQTIHPKTVASKTATATTTSTTTRPVSRIIQTTAKKGLAKFSNPIESQRLFQSLNTKINELEKTLANKVKETQELTQRWNHATRLGVGYATVVQYLAIKLKLDSDVDLLKECEILKSELSKLRSNEENFESKINDIIEQHKRQLQSEIDLKRDIETELNNTRQSHKDEMENLKNAHNNEMFILREKHVSAELALQERINGLESELGIKSSELAELRKEHDVLYQSYNKLEESLTKDKDARVKYAQEKISQLQKDVDSLNTVLEMRLEKIHNLEKDSLMLQEADKELTITKELNKTLSHQLESASAALEKKRKLIERLTVELEDLKQKFNVEHKERRRMTMKTEELRYALNESFSGETNQTLDTSILDLEVKIIDITSKAKLLQVEQDLLDSKHVGLSIIDENKEHLVVICLTTQKNIYVILPKNEQHVAFLKHQLESLDIIFYTIDGFWDADLLMRDLEIKLEDQIDLIALDIHLTIIEHTHRGGAPNKQYSVNYIVDEIKPDMLDYQQLLSKWLKANLNPKCSPEEIEAIKLNPLNSMAKNAIKKRAALVRSLGLKMIEEFHSIRDQKSKDIYSLALRADDETKENYELKNDNSFNELCNTLNQCKPVGENNLS